VNLVLSILSRVFAPGRRIRGDRGSATAELAAALPALMVLLFVGLSAVEAVLAQMRCVDAARDAALTAARDGDGVTAGQARAPQGATVTIVDDGQDVRATVRLVVHPLGGHLPGIPISASAVADHEPGFPP
jgi:Flp pilus assembly protein TadG